MCRKEYNRMYYLKHRDKIIKRSSEWNKNNSERYKEYNIQRYKKINSRFSGCRFAIWSDGLRVGYVY